MLNATQGRWASVAVAIVAAVGLVVLLFTQRKAGFILMCGCYIISFIIGVMGSVGGETGIVTGVVMSFTGSIFVPGITFLFIRRDWKALK